jgi:predicted nucleic acid-binding protein
MTTSLRVLLDVNVWVANLMAAARGRQGTTAQRIVAMVTSGRWGDEAREVQLVISLEMLETLETVVRRQGASSDAAEAYIDAVAGIMKNGPDELDPYLVLGGRDQFAMADVEDAGVLATAFAAKAALLVTDNLKDFQTKDALRVDTRVVEASSGSSLRLSGPRSRRNPQTNREPRPFAGRGLEAAAAGSMFGADLRHLDRTAIFRIDPRPESTKARDTLPLVGRTRVGVPPPAVESQRSPVSRLARLTQIP